MKPIDRYTQIVRWARRRYTYGGRLVLWNGNGPSAFTRIEHAAARKHLHGVACRGTFCDSEKQECQP